MNYFKDANALFDHARNDYQKIKQSYFESLHDKEIKTTLLIEIKNLMENMRSTLDFCAHGIHEKYCRKGGKNPKIYFPYAALSIDKSQFQKRLEECIPGISVARPDIATELEKFQHFSHPANRWLPIFMELNNENKHQRLTPQIRRENKELRITSGGASMSLGEGALSLWVCRFFNVSVRGVRLEDMEW